MSKYGAVQTDVDGEHFASKAESRRWQELRLLEQAGTIRHLRRQPAFELQRAFTDMRGVRHQAIRYVGDFSYDENGTLIVEDVKGVETAVFKVKAKLLIYMYPMLELRVVK